MWLLYPASPHQWKTVLEKGGNNCNVRASKELTLVSLFRNIEFQRLIKQKAQLHYIFARYAIQVLIKTCLNFRQFTQIADMLLSLK